VGLTEPLVPFWSHPTKQSESRPTSETYSSMLPYASNGIASTAALSATAFAMFPSFVDGGYEWVWPKDSPRQVPALTS
jgi:hypothetical protein